MPQEKLKNLNGTFYLTLTKQELGELSQCLVDAATSQPKSPLLNNIISLLVESAHKHKCEDLSPDAYTYYEKFIKQQ